LTDKKAKLTVGGQDPRFARPEGHHRSRRGRHPQALCPDRHVHLSIPGFTSTASCESALTYIDGDEGVLLHRGYPIGQLAEHSSFMEVSTCC
jgi:citrate synthase